MQKRLEQERAQARVVPLAAALAEAQQVICTASTDYTPYAHTHSHMHWPRKGSDIYIEKERDHSYRRYIGLHLSIVVHVGVVNPLMRALTGPGTGRAAGQRLPRAACALFS